MLIDTRWCNYTKEETIGLTIGNTTINLTVSEAEEVFNELSQILYGRVLTDDNN